MVSAIYATLNSNGRATTRNIRIDTMRAKCVLTMFFLYYLSKLIYFQNPLSPMKLSSVRHSIYQFVRGNAVNATNQQGKSYPSDILRKMPFTQLHSLYFVLLKERNLLESMKLNCKLNQNLFMEGDNLQKVKLSMKRLLQVVGEREKLPNNNKDTTK